MWWPGPAAWKELQGQLSGPLIAVQSPWPECKRSPLVPACGELLRQAKNPYFLGDEVAFCVYVRSQNLFVVIDDAAVSRILAGRLQIDFTPESDQASSPLAPVKRFLSELRGQIRRGMRANVTFYHAFQRLRGRRYTREEILQFHREEFGEEPELLVPRVENIARISRGVAKLDTPALNVHFDF